MCSNRMVFSQYVLFYEKLYMDGSIFNIQSWGAWYVLVDRLSSGAHSADVDGIGSGMHNADVNWVWAAQCR
jgi:hypothetical protein